MLKYENFDILSNDIINSYSGYTYHSPYGITSNNTLKELISNFCYSLTINDNENSKTLLKKIIDFLMNNDSSRVNCFNKVLTILNSLRK